MYVHHKYTQSLKTSQKFLIMLSYTAANYMHNYTHLHA